VYGIKEILKVNLIKDKVAIVTGGARGIGRAICLMLAKQGCHVAFNYVKSTKDAAALEKEIKSLGVKCKATQVDIKDFDKVKEWTESIKKEFGTFHILINNAGIIADKALMLMALEDWQKVIDTNLTGVFNITRCCITTLLKQKEGHIINISSISGKIGLPRQVNYSASKGGLDAFAKALAKEVAAYNVRVNSVAPGFIETDILKEFSQEDRENINKTIPLRRVGTPEDVAGCVKFLLSPEAQYIIGENIQMDGGLAIR